MAAQHPGKTLLEQYLIPNTISQNRLAKTIAVPPRRINEIILGKRAITTDTAVRLAEYFGNSASYWMHLQAEYDIQLAREKLVNILNRIQPIYQEPARLNPTPQPRRKQKKTNKNIKGRIMR